MFCNFTKENIDYFIKNKYNLSENNSLLKFLNNEQNNIISFINKKTIDIQINYNYNCHVSKYCNSRFVDYNNLLKYNDFILHEKSILISWNEQKIIIKTNSFNNIVLLKIKILIYIIEYLNLKHKKFKLILILSNLTKITPYKQILLNAEHINSGYSHIPNKLIVVWRYEEFEKVILHEIIHFFKLDKNHDSVNMPDIILTDKYSHNYNEAITDFYGICYHIIYISIILNINVKILLEIELSFIENQAMKLNSFFELGNWTKKPLKFIKQKTSAFSYYIIKYLLFKHIINKNNIEIKNYLENLTLKEIIRLSLDTDFKQLSFKDISSFRMTLFQLKY